MFWNGGAMTVLRPTNCRGFITDAEATRTTM